MAEENKPQEGEGQEPQGPGEGTDWKAMARKWERQAKANKEKADAYDRLQEDAKSDLQRATDRADAAERKLAEMTAARERDAARAKVAERTGVPASLITGDDEEAMEGSAKALLAWAKPSAPRAPRPGTYSDGAGEAGDGRSELARKLFGKD